MRTGTAILAIAALGVAAAPSGVLPRGSVVGLDVVRQYFPQVTREQYSGRNGTAAGKPTATLSVIFANADASKKVTLTVDRYATGSAALAGYRDAVGKSKIPGFAPLAVPKIGQTTFAGRVTRGAETHVGLGAVDGNSIVGATLAGFPATPANINRLVSLAKMEAVTAKKKVAL